ncbi:uncharacterized protein M6B38_368200 [Iris pallida]|uniref:Histone H2A n=1 Tax=Iris pallida TaxID=29817 RepID=A0AAX6GFD6_IRIPA|nr:uncharacterized protein M6B38_368200 [Iris pallida]
METGGKMKKGAGGRKAGGPKKKSVSTVRQGRPPVPHRPHRPLPQEGPLRQARRQRRPRLPRRRGSGVGWECG